MKNQFKDADWSIKLDYSKGDFDEGIHNVEVIQYQDNDPEKEILFYRTMQYEVQDI